LGVPQDEVAILKHGDLPKRIEVNEGALLMRAGRQVDGLEVELQPKKCAKEPYFVAVPRKFHVVELASVH
jgi:hypothetical protein